MTKTKFVIRQTYLKRNGGIEKVLNDLDKKAKYEKYLTRLYVHWTQKRTKSNGKASPLVNK